MVLALLRMIHVSSDSTSCSLEALGLALLRTTRDKASISSEEPSLLRTSCANDNMSAPSLSSMR